MGRSRQYVFGEFRLDVRQRALFRQQELIALMPKSLETLLFLVERHGQIVDKKELLEAVWPDTFVEEVSLARNVSLLRKALSDHQDGHAFIETIPKRGYRFVAPVEIEDLPSGQTELTPTSEPHAPEPSILLGRRIPSFRRKWVLTLAVAGICVGVLGGIYLRSWPAPRPPLIIVLPVQNLTGDATREYVADGLTEELIAKLGSLGSDKMSVIARTSAMSYKNSNKTAAQVGRELGVNYVIESSVRQWGDRVRITAQLIRVRDESHLWVRDFYSSGQDLLTIEEEIARDVANEIEFRLTPTAAKPPRRTHPIKREAYEAYLQGRYFWSRRGLANFQKAIGYFQQAIQIDPEYAAAYAGLADAYADQGFWGGTPNEAIPKAKAAAVRALQLDDSSSEAHDALGSIADIYDWDWKTGETEHRRALELNPNNAAAHLEYASHLVSVGLREKAREEVRKAQSLDPLSPFFRAAGGLMLYFAGYREEGIQQNLKAIELAPDFLVPHLNLSQFYFEMGNYDLGILEYEKGSRLAGMRPDTLAALLDSYKSQGISGFRREQLKLNEKGLLQLDSFSLAVIHAGLGEKEKAIQYLQQNFQEHGAYLEFIGADWRWDSLRGESEFQTILREMHFRQ
jgi:TolB-like protein/DNA-binding winged helix-turn-helix (wHTH) protein/Tfp pilus assembly protein PilF